MNISEAEILKIAQLANLRFEPAELKRFAAEFSGILDYFESLQTLDLTGVEPTSHVAGAGGPDTMLHRADREQPGLALEDALREAPEKGDGHFLVPRFIG